MNNFEQLVIGSILLDNQCLPSVETEIEPADFLNLDYSEAFRAIIELGNQDSPIDVFTLAAELENQKYTASLDAVQLSGIQDLVPSALRAVYYSEQVKDAALKRKVKGLGAILKDEDLSGSEAIDEAMRQLTEANHVSAKTIHDGNDSINAFIQNLEDRLSGAISHQSTGFDELDEMIDGLVAGRLYVIGGRPGSGKTALALNFAADALKKDIPTLIFNMEMSHEEVMGRMISICGRVNHKNPKDLGDDGMAKLVAGASMMKDKPFKVDDSTGYKIGHVKNTIRMHHKENGNSFVVIDYLQLMNYDGDNANQGLGLITRELKSLAKELKIPIVLLAQVNRGCEQRPDKRPLASDLRDSGGIESDADCIIMCYRDVIYSPDTEFKDVAEIIIRKNRQGASGTVHLRTKLQYFLFEGMKTNFTSQG